VCRPWGVRLLLRRQPRLCRLLHQRQWLRRRAANAGAADRPPREPWKRLYKQVNPSVVSVKVIQSVSASSFLGTVQGSQTVLGSGFVWDNRGI